MCVFFPGLGCRAVDDRSPKDCEEGRNDEVLQYTRIRNEKKNEYTLNSYMTNRSARAALGSTRCTYLPTNHLPSPRTFVGLSIFRFLRLIARTQQHIHTFRYTKPHLHTRKYTQKSIKKNTHTHLYEQ